MIQLDTGREKLSTEISWWIYLSSKVWQGKYYYHKIRIIEKLQLNMMKKGDVRSIYYLDNFHRSWFLQC